MQLRTQLIGGVLSFLIFSDRLCFADSATQSLIEFKKKGIELSQSLYQLNEKTLLKQEKIDLLKKQVLALKGNQKAILEEIDKIKEKKRLLEHPIKESYLKLEILKDEVSEQIKKSFLQEKKSMSVLSILEKFQLNPPPALLVSPTDALQAIHSLVLVASFLPILELQAKKIQLSLDELLRIEKDLKVERDHLLTLKFQHEEAHFHLSLLQEKQQILEQTSGLKLSQEKKEIADIKEKARLLNQVISNLKLQKKHLMSLKRKKGIQAIYKDNLQMSFLRYPKNVQRIKQSDNPEENVLFNGGAIFKTEPGALITAPISGRILYASVFRSYGNLIIMDIGSGYQLIVSGLEKLDVVPGNLLLRDERLGFMPKTPLVSGIKSGIKEKSPVFYIELRKDGQIVDIDKWWKSHID